MGAGARVENGIFLTVKKYRVIELSLLMALLSRAKIA